MVRHSNTNCWCASTVGNDVMRHLIGEDRVMWNFVFSSGCLSGSILLLKRIHQSYQKQTKSSVDQWSIGRRKWLFISIISSTRKHNMHSLLWVEISKAYSDRESGDICASLMTIMRQKRKHGSIWHYSRYWNSIYLHQDLQIRHIHNFHWIIVNWGSVFCAIIIFYWANNA